MRGEVFRDFIRIKVLVIMITCKKISGKQMSSPKKATSSTPDLREQNEINEMHSSHIK